MINGKRDERFVSTDQLNLENKRGFYANWFQDLDLDVEVRDTHVQSEVQTTQTNCGSAGWLNRWKLRQLLVVLYNYDL